VQKSFSVRSWWGVLEVVVLEDSNVSLNEISECHLLVFKLSIDEGIGIGEELSTKLLRYFMVFIH
jgi:hypothetical protein